MKFSQLKTMASEAYTASRFASSWWRGGWWGLAAAAASTALVKVAKDALVDPTTGQLSDTAKRGLGSLERSVESVLPSQLQPLLRQLLDELTADSGNTKLWLDTTAKHLLDLASGLTEGVGLPAVPEGGDPLEGGTGPAVSKLIAAMAATAGARASVERALSQLDSHAAAVPDHLAAVQADVKEAAQAVNADWERLLAVARTQDADARTVALNNELASVRAQLEATKAARNAGVSSELEEQVRQATERAATEAALSADLRAQLALAEAGAAKATAALDQWADDWEKLTAAYLDLQQEGALLQKAGAGGQQVAEDLSRLEPTDEPEPAGQDEVAADEADERHATLEPVTEQGEEPVEADPAVVAGVRLIALLQRGGFLGDKSGPSPEVEAFERATRLLQPGDKPGIYGPKVRNELKAVFGVAGPPRGEAPSKALIKAAEQAIADITRDSTAVAAARTTAERALEHSVTERIRSQLLDAAANMPAAEAAWARALASDPQALDANVDAESHGKADAYVAQDGKNRADGTQITASGPLQLHTDTARGVASAVGRYFSPPLPPLPAHPDEEGASQVLRGPAASRYAAALVAWVARALAGVLQAPQPGSPISAASVKALSDQGGALLAALKAAQDSGLPPGAALLRAFTKYTSIPGATAALAAAGVERGDGSPPPRWAVKLADYDASRQTDVA